MKSISCFASQNKLQLLGNLEKIVSSNSSHIQTTSNNIISTACMKDEQHCNTNSLIPIKPNTLIKNNIFITLRHNGMFFQCVNTNWVLTTKDRDRVQCSLQPVKVELPIECPDGTRLGMINFAEFNVINKNPSSLSDDLLHHHNALIRFKQQWNNKDIKKMLSHSLGELSTFEEIKPSYILAVIIACTMLLLCSPCIILAFVTFCKYLPGCMKKWTPKFNCSCSWCGTVITLCYKSKQDDTEVPETPDRPPASPKTPSAPKQTFRREKEKSRESRLRKKSLKEQFTFWDDEVQKGESFNPEPAEAPPAPQGGPVMGLGGYSVYPNFATVPQPIQPQLHYSPYAASVTYQPTQQQQL